MSGADTQTIEEVETRTRQVPLWKVLFHNDDVTPMDFVTGVLGRFFHHDRTEAYRIMMLVHTRGIGLAGVYPLEIAELKQEQVVSAARPFYPLQVSLEPA
jgi:ATP-dependent Clp protease adaptor protein ClpS